MATFSRTNGRYQVSYITGPSHVLVGIVLGGQGETPKVVRHSNSSTCEHGPLDERRICESVLEGIAESGAKLVPSEIHYVEGDSPNYGLYKYCGLLLARRIASGEDFTEPKGDAA